MIRRSLLSPWRGFIGAVAVVASVLLAPLPAHAADAFPDRPVTLVVGFPPGGAVDLIARDLAKALQERWGQPVVVRNRAGSGSMLAADSVAKAAPNGLTLLLATDSSIVVIPFIQDKVPYEPLRDLQPIGLVANVPMMLIATPSMKARTLQEFIAEAKSRPGAIDYGSFGFGTSHHLSMERLQQAAGIKVNHVPYGGGSPTQDLLAGHIPVMWSGVSSALPHIESGKATPSR